MLWSTRSNQGGLSRELWKSSPLPIRAPLNQVVVYVEVVNGREYLEPARKAESYECKSAAIDSQELNVPKMSTLWLYIETSKVPKIDEELFEARVSQSTRSGTRYSTRMKPRRLVSWVGTDDRQEGRMCDAV